MRSSCHAGGLSFIQMALVGHLTAVPQAEGTGHSGTVLTFDDRSQDRWRGDQQRPRKEGNWFLFRFFFLPRCPSSSRVGHHFQKAAFCEPLISDHRLYAASSAGHHVQNRREPTTMTLCYVLLCTLTLTRSKGTSGGDTESQPGSTGGLLSNGLKNRETL